MKRYNTLTVDIKTTDLAGMPVTNRNGKMKSVVTIKIGPLLFATGSYGGKPSEQVVLEDFNNNPYNKARFTLGEGFESAKQLGLVK